MRILPVGTSLTAGGLPNTQPRGWYCDVFGIGSPFWTGVDYGAPRSPSTPAAKLPRGVVTPPVAVHRPIIAEIGGAKLADNLASWSTLVTQYEPFDALLVEGNINDVINATAIPTFTAQVNQILDLAAKYSQVFWMAAMMGPIGSGENPTLFGNAFNLSVDNYNSIIQTQMALRSAKYTFCNIRPQLKTWETTNNTGNLGQGLLFVDGVHMTEWGLGVTAGFTRPSVVWAS